MRLFLPAVLFVTGCASLPPVPPAEAPEQQCLVCRHRRDFDCLAVAKSPRAPHADYAGRTHYFCSESCRTEFQRAPQNYWPPR